MIHFTVINGKIVHLERAVMKNYVIHTASLDYYVLRASYGNPSKLRPAKDKEIEYAKERGWYVNEIERDNK